MKTLIIGGSGFVGPYLCNHLINDLKWDVDVTKTENEELEIAGARVLNCDILDMDSLKSVFEASKPDYVIHLAAQSSVAVSWKKPQLTANVNIIGCINLLETIKELDKKPRVLLVGSGEEYGHISEDACPIEEDTVLRPGNIYAATKSCQNMLGRIYSDAYGIDVMMSRSFNHIGPNQKPIFVIPDFCKQVADIEKGVNPPVMYVGNLSAKRDFTDVRDVVRAYALIVSKGKAGETYNVGSGHALMIQEMLDKILSLSDAKIEVKTDPKR